jgi:hypothetical protein
VHLALPEAVARIVAVLARMIHEVSCARGQRRRDGRADGRSGAGRTWPTA